MKKRNELQPDPGASNVDPAERRLMDLMNGTAKPENDEEREFLKERDKIESEGGMMEIPSNI